MDRQTMLDRLGYLELQRITDLSDSALRKEVTEWFLGDDDNVIATDPRHKITLDYLNNYMMWQEDKSDEELLEMLAYYAKN